ncbi:PAS domain-containing protein [Hyphomicrobium sp.]|uniref:PAS domain-containing protein n=1 Tax=Hyphomicrobium sp. TaxID=82 RepID=UPI002D7A1BAD|nr:PAS domain-containing protein [Hyphomicrobium sp.]HET6388539.1 PAS domain-containing protein [Hyphomicrobium sp.]
MQNDTTEASAEALQALARRDFRTIAGPMFEVLERSRIPVAVTDPKLPDNPVILANEAFTRLSGYSTQDILGRNLRILQGTETDKKTIAEISQAIKSARPIDVQILNYRKDRSLFLNGMSIVPIIIDDDVRFFVSTHADVASRREVERVDAELKESQRQLDHANERLRMTLSLTGAAAAWEWQIDKNKILGDPRFAALYGLKPEDAANGVSPGLFFSIIHPEDQTRIRLAIGGILRGAEVFSKEYRILLPNRRMRWVHARGRCHYDENDRPVRFNGVLVDITERKIAEERLRIAQSAGGIGTYEHIQGFGTASVSDQFCRLLGLQSAQDLPVRTINGVVHPDDPPLVDESDRLRAAGPASCELRVIRADTGEIRWLAKRGEYVRDAETAGPRFSGVIYDITQSKLAEQQLLTLNETLETRVQERTRERDGIWQLSQDLLGVADANGVWQSVNPAWTRVLGWSANEIIGRTSDWLEHPDDQAGKRSPFGTDASFALNFKNRLRTKQGDYRSFAWTAARQAGLFYCVARDMTEQLQREETLARAEEQLRQAHKMEAVGQLTGGIAHDFNNMLTGVIASLGLIQRRLKAGRTDGLTNYIEAGLDSANRAATLTHSLLAFARRQSLDIKAQDVNARILGIQEILRRPLGEDIKLQFNLAAELWPAMTDSNQFESALLNLILNSRDAMPEGGRITIETANAEIPAAPGEGDNDVPGGDFVVVSVSDTGSGMAPDVIAKVFEPFFTTKPIGQGTGLGLSMIYGFVKQSGGHVRITSEVGRGTTVTIYLRRAKSLEEEASQGTDVQPPRGRGETILVVEDDQAVRFTVTELLKELGYSYIEAEDASAAIPHLQGKQQIDLLVTDVGLPNMNGRQLAEIGRQHRPDLKVLFITGYAEKAAVRGEFLGPDMQMLGKPFTVEALGAKIRQMIQGH